MKEPTGRQHSSAGEAPNMWYTVMADLGTNACGTRPLNSMDSIKEGAMCPNLPLKAGETEGRKEKKEKRKERRWARICLDHTRLPLEDVPLREKGYTSASSSFIARTYAYNVCR